MKKRIILAAAALLLLSIILFSFLKSRREENVLPEVEWTKAEMKPLEETISASGEFQPHSREIISARTGGTVDELSVEEGEWVEAGRILLTLDKTDYTQRVLQEEAYLEKIRRTIDETLLSSRLEYLSSEMTLRQSREKLEKQEELFKLEAITEEELSLSRDRVEREAQNLAALGKKLNLLCARKPDDPPLLTDDRDDEIIDMSPDVRQQTLILEGARRDLERCTVKAEEAGRVVKISPEKGTPVAAGEEVVVMQGSGPMEAVVTVDEVDIGKLHEGDKVLVKSDSLIGEEIPGYIIFLSPILELFGNTRAGKVTIALDETDLPLRSGASCVAEISTTARESALTVPAEAIMTNRGRITLFRLDDTDDGRTRLTEVEPETGVSTIDDLEILKGLAEGDRIALPAGDLILRDGLYVIPAERDDREESVD